MIHSVTLRKTTAVIGPALEGAEIRKVSHKGWPDQRTARERVFRILKREYPDENPMCWVLVAYDDEPVSSPTL